jgi:hypothetical protein
MRARSFSRTIATVDGPVLLEPPDRQGRPLVAAFRLNGSMRSRGARVLSFFVLFIGSAQRGIEPAMGIATAGRHRGPQRCSQPGRCFVQSRKRMPLDLWALSRTATVGGHPIGCGRPSHRGSAAQVDIATAGDGSALGEGGTPSQRSIRAALVLSRSAAGRGNSIAPAPGAEDGAGALAERDRRTGRDDPIATLDRGVAVVVEAGDSPAPG